jgi:transcriptional regulator with XRE-family HTH domain
MLSIMQYSVTKAPSIILLEIANKIKALRKHAKYSQSELAERSGVSLGSLKRFENSGQISLESLLKLIHILDRLDEFSTILEPNDNLKHIEKLFSK